MPSGITSGMLSSMTHSITDQSEKVRENRLRRAAQRQGLILIKSRRRDPRALDYGKYNLIADTAGNRAPDAQARREPCELSLDDVERQLTA